MLKTYLYGRLMRYFGDFFRVTGTRWQYLLHSYDLKWGHQLWNVKMLIIFVLSMVVRSVTICDRIREKSASTHTTARHTFHHQAIAVHVD